MKGINIYIFFFVFFAETLKAQDHIYSQFYNAPQYLNPALIGQFNSGLRLNFNYRNQWTNISDPLTYYSFAADLNLPNFNGGFGLLTSKSNEGVANLNKTNFSAIYAYSVDFGNVGNISFGIQGGLTNRKIDYDKLVFFDQLDKNGIILGGISATTPPEFNNKYFFDSSTGINLVVGNLMIGGAASHINKPNESFTGTKSILPLKIDGYISYKFILDYFEDENSPSLTPSILYYDQANLKSISAGFQIKNRGVNLGLWYRGDTKQKDAIVISIILDIFSNRDNNNIRLGLSHDATTSKLGYGNTGGTTEGALILESNIFNNFNYRSSHHNNDSRRCYEFY